VLFLLYISLSPCVLLLYVVCLLSFAMITLLGVSRGWYMFRVSSKRWWAS